MKLACLCGHTIIDQTDRLSYKALAMPDQDQPDFWVEVGGLIEQVLLLGASGSDTATKERSVAGIRRQIVGAFARRTKLLYQCPECGRLYVQEVETNSYCTFIPEDCPDQKSILRSVQGDQWKRSLYGWWDVQDKEGALEGFAVLGDLRERFDDWDALQARYFEVFERLRDEGLLRSASLRKGGRVVHKWPSD